jgi:hypothetical protein
VPALRRVIETFFNNSAESVVATLINGQALKMTDAELDRLEQMIKSAKRRRQ